MPPRVAKPMPSLSGKPQFGPQPSPRPRDMLDDMMDSMVRACADDCPDHLRICGPRREITGPDGRKHDTWSHRFLVMDALELHCQGYFERDIPQEHFITLLTHYVQQCPCCRAAGVPPGQRREHPQH